MYDDVYGEMSDDVDGHVHEVVDDNVYAYVYLKYAIMRTFMYVLM